MIFCHRRLFYLMDTSCRSCCCLQLQQKQGLVNNFYYFSLDIVELWKKFVNFAVSFQQL